MSTNAIGGSAAAPTGFLSLAVERQQTAALLAIKTQAKTAQAAADMVAQAVQQGQQAQKSASGTPSPMPQRGSTLNILV